MSSKCQWVKLTVVAYKTVLVQVPDGPKDKFTDEKLKSLAEREVFDRADSGGYTIDECDNAEILTEDPGERHCRSHEIERIEADEDDLVIMTQELLEEGGSK